ncbi:hypothetical protein HHI36_010366 [Cryptolaemus montrouzieri]|uniref:Uncharacterized protein n=1 Tax=Cryptolaemus montrouzieri TaxID=559131 RepID=A0ABD2MII2_9CUCU
MDHVLDSVGCGPRWVVVAGDLNDNMMVESSAKRKITNLFRSHGLQCLFIEPTKVTTTSFTCIDNIFANFKFGACFKETIDPHISDHKAQKLCIPSCIPVENTYKKTRNFNEQNPYQFIRNLEKLDWNNYALSESADVCFDVFHRTVIDNLNFSISENGYFSKDQIKK